MAGSFVFSRSAEKDIVSIVRHSMAQFGDAQTTAYMAGLEEALNLLAAHPDMGAQFAHERSAGSTVDTAMEVTLSTIASATSIYSSSGFFTSECCPRSICRRPTILPALR